MEAAASWREIGLFQLLLAQGQLPDRRSTARPANAPSKSVAWRREPRPASVAISGGALEIVWMEDGHVSRYPLEWLSQHADARRRPDPANLPRSAWYGDHYPDIARFSQPKLLGDRRETAGWIEALLVEGVAIVDDMPDNDEALTRNRAPDRPGATHVLRRIFRRQDAHQPGQSRLHRQSAGIAHRHRPPRTCRPACSSCTAAANSVEGGMSLFLDGLAVAEDLRKESPEDFKLLSETLIPFYCEHDTFDMRARQRVIELDEQRRSLRSHDQPAYGRRLRSAANIPRSFLPRVLPLRPDAPIRRST